MAKAYEMPFGRLTVDPAEDFGAKRYTFVTVNGEGLGIEAPAGSVAVGIIQEPNDIGEPAQVTTDGVSFAILGGTVAAGDPVAVGADGQAVKAAEGAAVVGVCMVGGDAGDIGSILLK